MNAWNREQIEGEPLLESCDFCNALIVNWETLTNCWVTGNINQLLGNI